MIASPEAQSGAVSADEQPAGNSVVCKVSPSRAAVAYV